MVLPLAVEVAGRGHIGLLRDISSAGIFFYSKALPRVGSQIRLILNVSALDPAIIVCCICRVVRVVPGLGGAATGVGVTIEAYGQTNPLENGHGTTETLPS